MIRLGTHQVSLRLKGHAQVWLDAIGHATPRPSVGVLSGLVLDKLPSLDSLSSASGCSGDNSIMRECYFAVAWIKLAPPINRLN